VKTQVLCGRFLKSNGQPFGGEIEFLPVEIGYEEDGIYYAHKAPHMVLEDGNFSVELDVTEYFVYTPIGRWRVSIKGKDGVGFLSDYLPSRFQ